ncbi:redox-regulated ATPase YchF [Candidatus Woesearchaeota archaeon]|nr:redox-regulated ATPase YchF [Candidatus Woesearchaeota archaeon]
MLVGIVGKPSCGKSTFFKAATLAEVEIANYPFTTIKPNHAVGYVRVPCAAKHFGVQCNPRFGYCVKDIRFVPVDLMDVAGLVPGAHLGHGMGNQFLDDLRQADVLIHVVDISGSVNEKGEPVQPLSYNPENDIRFLETELNMWYLGLIKKGWERFARQIVQEKKEIHKALGAQLSGLKVSEDLVKEAIQKLYLNPEKPHEWTEKQLFELAAYLRAVSKPMLIACNKIDVPGADKNFTHLKGMFPQYLFIPCSAEAEAALREAARAGLISYLPGDNTFTMHEDKLSMKQKSALDFIRKNVLVPFGSTGVQEVLDKAVFDFLKYMAIFPGGINKLADSDGRVLPDCFLLPPASTALDFAYRLHTDLGKNFIRAIDVKTRRTVGKEHLLQHCDVIEIVSAK